MISNSTTPWVSICNSKYRCYSAPSNICVLILLKKCSKDKCYLNIQKSYAVDTKTNIKQLYKPKNTCTVSKCDLANWKFSNGHVHNAYTFCLTNSIYGNIFSFLMWMKQDIDKVCTTVTCRHKCIRNPSCLYEWIWDWTQWKQAINKDVAAIAYKFMRIEIFSHPIIIK